MGWPSVTSGLAPSAGRWGESVSAFVHADGGVESGSGSESGTFEPRRQAGPVPARLSLAAPWRPAQGGSARPDPPKPKGCQTPELGAVALGCPAGQPGPARTGQPGPRTEGERMSITSSRPRPGRRHRSRRSRHLWHRDGGTDGRCTERRHRLHAGALRLPGRHADELRHQHQRPTGSGAARRGAVAAAGGVVVQSWPQIGVVVAHSDRATFRTAVKDNGKNAIESSGPPDRFRHRGHPRGNPDPWGPGAAAYKKGAKKPANGDLPGEIAPGASAGDPL